MGKQWHYVGSVYTWERGSTSTGIQYRYCRGSWDLSEQKPQVDHRTARVRRGPEQEHSNGTRELQMRNPQPWGKMGADRRKESIPGKKEFILNIGKSLSVRCQSRTSYPLPHLSPLFPVSAARVSNIGRQHGKGKGSTHRMCYHRVTGKS